MVGQSLTDTRKSTFPQKERKDEDGTAKAEGRHARRFEAILGKASSEGKNQPSEAHGKTENETKSVHSFWIDRKPP